MKFRVLSALLLTSIAFTYGTALAQQTAAAGNEGPATPAKSSNVILPLPSQSSPPTRITPFAVANGGATLTVGGGGYGLCYYAFPAVSVPTGQTLVLQQVSWALGDLGGLYWLTITATSNGTTVEHWVANWLSGSQSQSTQHVTAIPLALYADGASSVVVKVYYDYYVACSGSGEVSSPPTTHTGGLALFSYQLSGYLTNQP